MERPFFYRLSDPRPRDNTSDVDVIRQTVVEEVRRILSTRSSGPVYGERNLFNFGIPNVVESYHAAPDIEVLVNQIKEAIEAYEPRLRNIKVSFDRGKSWNLQPIKIEAALIIDGIEEKFTLAL